MRFRPAGAPSSSPREGARAAVADLCGDGGPEILLGMYSNDEGVVAVGHDGVVHYPPGAGVNEWSCVDGFESGNASRWSLVVP